MSRVNARHALELPVGVVFRHPTISTLAADIEATLACRDAAGAELAAEIACLSDKEVALLLAEEEASLGRAAR